MNDNVQRTTKKRAPSKETPWWRESQKTIINMWG